MKRTRSFDRENMRPLKTKQKRRRAGDFADGHSPRRLEIVLKCDSMGSQEAVLEDLQSHEKEGVEVSVIHTAVGSVSKSDLDMALTGSRLVIGFNVGVMPKIQELSQERGIEVRLYDVIYKLTADLQEIADGLISKVEKEEKVTGKAKVIALFKSSRKGIILGCQVQKGILSVGSDFRVISAMGPVYSGRILSLQIEKHAVAKAEAGRQVGLKIPDFKGAKIGDLVECFEKLKPKKPQVWQPRGGVFKYGA